MQSLKTGLLLQTVYYFVFVLSVVLAVKKLDLDIGDSCGGFTPEPRLCGAGQFCNYTLDAACSASDVPGTCAAIPEACTLEFSPVCGCDGQTYSNACEAWLNSTSVSATTSCEDTSTPVESPQIQGEGQTCGGFRPPPQLVCGEGLFCNYTVDDICGFADAPGICSTLPTACTMEVDPVCGCDSQTYNNKCAAWSSGTAVQSTGECPVESTGVGSTLTEGDDCTANRQCGSKKYCKYEKGSCPARNKSERSAGRCALKRTNCNKKFSPVCGCDGKTYSNKCVAGSAGVSVRRSGEC